MRRLAVICGVGPRPDETFIRRDLAALRRRGWEPRVFGLDEARSFPAPPAALYPRLLGKALGMAPRPRQACALLRRAPVVSAAAGYAGTEGILLAEFAWLTADIASAASSFSGRPWGCFVHGWDVFARPPAELASRLRGAGAVIACSAAARDAVLRAGIPRELVHLVHHGLPLDEMEKSRRPKRPMAVCAVGRLEEKKGFDLLLRAWPLVRARAPAATLRLIGEGSRRPSLESLAKEAGPGVEILPPMEERAVWGEISSAEVLVLPSRRTATGDRDGIANVLLEAMALGTAVVTTDAGAAGEVVVPGETGCLLDWTALSPQGLADAVADLLLDPERRGRWTIRARQVVEARFSDERTSAALDEVLASLVR